MDIQKIRNYKTSINRYIGMINLSPAIKKIVIYSFKIVFGFLMPNGMIFGACAPFGLSYAAAVGAAPGALAGVLGVILGYLSIVHKADGLKYIACTILIYTASFVFRETRLMKARWFMPAAALCAAASVGIVFVADSGFKLTETLMYASELVFVTAGAYFFGLIMNPEYEPGKCISAQPVKYSVGLLFFFSCLLIPLSAYSIFKTVSLGHTLAVFAVMLSAYFGGAGIGSSVGVALGLAVGMAESTAFYSAVYGFSAMAAGVFKNKGKTLFTIVYLAANASTMLMLNGMADITLLYGAFFASVTFMLIAGFFGDKLLCLFTLSGESGVIKQGKIRLYASEKLKSAASAFNDLSRMISGAAGSRRETNDNDVAGIFDRAAAQICRKCILANACWEKDYLSTRDALNTVTKKMLERGRLEPSDFPLHFSSRCVLIRDFVLAINRELSAYLYRKQYKNRIEESRNILYSQYRQMSHIFGTLAGNIESEPVFEERMEALIDGYLRNKQINAEAYVYRDITAHLHLHIEGTNLAGLTNDADAVTGELSDILGVSLASPQCMDTGDRQVFCAREKESLYATLGVAVNKKSNSEISGDSGAYFKTNNGKLYVILSDGMGSGRAAAAESAAAVGMLEKLIKSGIEPKTALMTIHSALTLKSEKTGSFTTLDLLCVDLYNGEASIFKFGGAPTYIKRGGHVRRVTSNALPAGVSCGRISDIESCVSLCEDDCVVMATDGVADRNDDVWLKEYLAGYDGESPKKLAGELLAQAYAKYGRADDMTVMVMMIKKNN